ncbi:PD-(D/E)XK nuclease family protein, partial [bacterium]|nr:PD-(D/E)XK nuclease family protein [bacterium]
YAIAARKYHDFVTAGIRVESPFKDSSGYLLGGERFREKIKKYLVGIRDKVEISDIKKIEPRHKITDVVREVAKYYRINEMEFYFPTGETQVNKIIESIIKTTNSRESKNFLKTLERLDFITTQGFMKGFIDLVFLHEDRYYIVDWKTNHLGDDYRDYKPEILEDYMISHAYNLQFYIYLLALHKYLKNRLVGYDFNKHIGGVYYFFLRGISAETNTGIYFNDLKDSFSIVSQLDTCFSGE